jgi:hypothetical protein
MSIQDVVPSTPSGLDLNDDGRVGSSSSYAMIAASRLCGRHVGLGGCALTLLCTQCGIHPTLQFLHITSREPNELPVGSVQDIDEIQLTTVDGRSRLLIMPSSIVLDAVSVIRASQREAVVPGAGLSGPIRPIHGPTCQNCDSFATARSATDIEPSFKKLLRSMQQSPSDSSETRLYTGCDCHTDPSSHCSNHRVSNVQTLSTAVPESSFSRVFGHTTPSHEDALAGVGEDMRPSTPYGVYIVDTRVQRMCRLSQSDNTPSSSILIKDGAAGQFHYKDASNTCATGPGVAQSIQTGTVGRIGASTMLKPVRNTSCVVCCTLLDDVSDLGLHDGDADISAGCTFRGVNAIGRNGSSVYLESLHNWAHYDCTVTCEKKFAACMGRCPRLNTFVSTMFDGSPRFENVCPECMRYDNADPFPAFSNNFKSPAFSTSSATGGYAPRVGVPSASHIEKTRGNIPSLKRGISTNWLSTASTMRKKAAVNAANGKLTVGQRKQQCAIAAQEWAQDRSGIFCDKKHTSWFSLDSDGKNPSPVSGMPFFDEYFGELRTYDNVQQRDRAIASHQSLVGMRDM